MMDHRQTTCSSVYRTTNQMSRNTSAPVPSQKELLNRINRHSFAMNEANLFLDTHPYDQDALAYFQKQRSLRIEAVKEYAKHYAPLAIDYAVDDNTPWSWVNEPWPWEGVEC